MAFEDFKMTPNRIDAAKRVQKYVRDVVESLVDDPSVFLEKMTDRQLLSLQIEIIRELQKRVDQITYQSKTSPPGPPQCSPDSAQTPQSAATNLLPHPPHPSSKDA